MWRALLCLLCLAAGSRQLSMSEFSVPGAIEAGEVADLLCKYELDKDESEKGLVLKWWWTPLNGTDEERKMLYQRIGGTSPTLVPHLQNPIEMLETDKLRLVNVTPEFSGTYECEVSIIDEVRQHKKLIVFSIGSGPLLNVSLTDEPEPSALVICEAVDVAPLPDITIRLNGEEVGSFGYVREIENGYYEIFENASIPLLEADGKEFECEILFQDKDVPHPPYVASELFTAPKASTPEPEEPATAPSATASEPSDNGSSRIGDSWILLTSFSLLALSLHNYSK